MDQRGSARFHDRVGPRKQVGVDEAQPQVGTARGVVAREIAVAEAAGVVPGRQPQVGLHQIAHLHPDRALPRTRRSGRWRPRIRLMMPVDAVFVVHSQIASRPGFAFLLRFVPHLKPWIQRVRWR